MCSTPTPPMPMHAHSASEGSEFDPHPTGSGKLYFVDLNTQQTAWEAPEYFMCDHSVPPALRQPSRPPPFAGTASSLSSGKWRWQPSSLRPNLAMKRRSSHGSDTSSRHRAVPRRCPRVRCSSRFPHTICPFSPHATASLIPPFSWIVEPPASHITHSMHTTNAPETTGLPHKHEMHRLLCSAPPAPTHIFTPLTCVTLRFSVHQH